MQCSTTNTAATHFTLNLFFFPTRNFQIVKKETCALRKSQFKGPVGIRKDGRYRQMFVNINSEYVCVNTKCP